MLLFGIDKVTKYHIDSPLYVSEQVWVLNKGKYDSLSPSQKQVMDAHCTSDWALRIAAPWADFESDGRGKLKGMPGQDVYALSPDQLAAWRKSAEPVVANWETPVRKAGHDSACDLRGFAQDPCRVQVGLLARIPVTWHQSESSAQRHRASPPKGRAVVRVVHARRPPLI
jgi:hypothetical protein